MRRGGAWADIRIEEFPSAQSFIVASRIDPQAMDLAHASVAGLALELPESHARATRATDAVRIASLLATGQLDVAIVARADAAAILAGSGAHNSVGPVPLCALAGLGEHLLVTVESFKARHAFLLARAVDHLRMSLPLTAAATELKSLPLPMHPGAAAYWSGQPLPEDASP